MAQESTALVVTDPQNDFLSPAGATWELVGPSVKENRTVEHIEQLLRAAKDGGHHVFVSPHYYYPTDSNWQFGGTLEKLMHEINMFSRRGEPSISKDSPGRGRTGLTATSPTSRTVTPWSRARTRSMGPKATT